MLLLVQVAYAIHAQRHVMLRPGRAAQEVSPGFRASLVQPFALRFALSIFRFASSQGWEIPLPIASCYPRVREEAFGMQLHAVPA